MSAFDLDLLIAILHHGLAFEDADIAAIGIESVNPGLQQLGGSSVLLHAKQVVVMDLSHFHYRLSLRQSDFGIRQRRRYHGGSAVVANSEEYAWRQQNLGFARLGGKRLPRLQIGRAYRARTQDLVANGSLPFHIINSSR